MTKLGWRHKDEILEDFWFKQIIAVTLVLEVCSGYYLSSFGSRYLADM